MASLMQNKLKSLKPSTKNIAEKYREILISVMKELSGNPALLKEALEVYLTAGKRPDGLHRECV